MTHNNIVSKDALVGIWKVVELKSIDKEQKISYPYGQNPVGYIIFTQEGYMSASLMMSNRLNLGLSVEELMGMAYGGAKPKLITNLFKYIKAVVRYLQAGSKFASQFSKYEIKDNKVILHVEVSIVPDLIGKETERTFEFSEDLLVLEASSGENIISSTWQRVS